MSSPDPFLDRFVSYEQYDDPSQQQTQTNDLKLCQFPDWDSKGTYDDDPPIYIHYSIVWKVTQNNRANQTRCKIQFWHLLPTGNTSSTQRLTISAKKIIQSGLRIQTLWFRSHSAKSLILQNNLRVLPRR
jgi:hypothetical protein